MSRTPVSRGTSHAQTGVAAPSAAVWTEAEWRSRIEDVARSVPGLLRLSDVQSAQLACYMALLQQWNRTYNLTAIRDAQDMLTHHLADCLVVVPPLLRFCDQLDAAAALPTHVGIAPAPSFARRRLLDVGSGGGLPGVILAIVCGQRFHVTCVDAVGKKAAFVQQAALTLNAIALRHGAAALPLQALHGRVEAIDVPAFEIVVSRAFASLVDFTSWSRGLLASGGAWLAMKGQSPSDVDLQALAEAGHAHVTQVEPLHVPGLDAQRCLVWLQPA